VGPLVCAGEPRLDQRSKDIIAMDDVAINTELKERECNSISHSSFAKVL